MLHASMQEALDKGSALENILLANKLITDEELALSMSEYLGIPAISLENFIINPQLLELLPHATWAAIRIIPIAKNGNMLTVAVPDPFNIPETESIRAKTGLEIHTTIARESEILAILATITKQPGKGLEDILRDVADDSEVEFGAEETEENVNLDEMMGMAEEAPVIRIVNSILVEALRKGVSDIHIEPLEKSMRLRYRLDGELAENPCPPKGLQSAIISRLKIMSNLDISERRVPQDGRFKIKALGKEVDIRISFLPTVHGEKIVMRILDKSSLAPSLEALGLEKRAYDNLTYAIRQPHGMICITGPTGSGKTTTLYSALQDLNTEGVNIITVEDPVEYQLEGINQVQADNNVGLTFAAALKSILRQDPDIVMIGEIRNGETGTIAVEAALTGHLVLSTLHTNDAPGAVARLAYMGIEPFMLASSLLMTQAQRLFRKLCPFCKQPTDVSDDMLINNHLDPESLRGTTFYRPVGCAKCNGIGYKGRNSLMEIMLLNDEIRHKILETTEAKSIRVIAEQTGMVPLREVGLDRIRDGMSSIEEIMRVTTE
jgi:type IV pilus assembly protein PilB